MNQTKSYNKLVRDKVLKRIINDGETPITHIANDEEYFQKLKEKLKEETEEFLEKENEEELADILEVINAICDFKKINKQKLEELRREKRKERGGFEKRIILEKTIVKS